MLPTDEINNPRQNGYFYRSKKYLTRNHLNISNSETFKSTNKKTRKSANKKQKEWSLEGKHFFKEFLQKLNYGYDAHRC